MLKSLQNQLLENIRKAYPNYRGLDDLFVISDRLGHKQSLCERKLRILVHSGLIEIEKDFKGHNKGYRAIIWPNLPRSEEIEPKQGKSTQERLTGLKLPNIMN